MRRARRIALIVAAALLSVAGASIANEGLADAGAVGRLPVLYEGRVMPFESAARLIRHRLSGRAPGARSASEWLTDLLLDPFASLDDELFLVDDPAVLEAVGAQEAERGRFSYADLYPHLDALSVLGASLAALTRSIDATEQEILFLANNVRLFEGIASTLDVFRASGGESGYAQLVLIGGAPAAETVEFPGMLRIVPLVEGGATRWLTPAGAVARLSASGDHAPATRDVLEAWNEMVNGADPTVSIPGIEAAIDTVPDARTLDARIAAEVFSSRVRPKLLSALGALLALAAALVGKRRARALALAGLGFAVVSLTAFEVLRFVITGRPPVTDLPSSFVFVAWVLAAVGFVVALRPGRFIPGLLVGSIATLALVYLARLVTGAADPFGVVQAVLDTNFWLTTHVLVVTSGYAGVIVAGVLGHVALIRRIRAAGATPEVVSAERAVLLAAVIGLALTTLGTVLGGIWADQSWGRFWGWDPKENGALLIILWVSVALHARMIGWVDGAGFCALSVFGIPVVFFSWLGVNLMGVGLHSYGFSDGSFWALVMVVCAETVFTAAGWIVARRRSDRSGFTVAMVTEVVADGDARCVALASPGLRYRRGQYVGVRPIRGRRSRPYSIVDHGDGRIRLLVKSDGAVSRRLVRTMRPGRRLLVSAPAGEFTFSTPRGRPVVFVAGGVGIAPVVTLLRDALDGGNRTVLIRCGRDRLYQDGPVVALAARHRSLQTIDILAASGARLSADLLRPRLSDLVHVGADWYLCGSPAFCERARAVAEELGADAIREERFVPRLAPTGRPAFRARVQVEDEEIELVPGQTILEGALAAGIDVAHSCMSGSCGECRCTVTAGSARQEVSPAIARTGDEIHACVSYADAPDGLRIERPVTARRPR